MAKNNKKTKVAITIFLITAIIVTALTAVLAFGEKNEGYRTITVIEIGGTVGVVHGNMEYAAYTGMHLEEGYTVVTNGNSYIRLLLDDDKYVKLESGTKAVFSEVSGGKTAIDIERGALVAEVTKPLQVDEDFIVNTPNAILAVRGTLFRVDLSRNDKGELNTDVMTYGGAVSSKRVQPSGEVEDIEVTIKEGFKATVNMDDKETVYLVDEVKVDLSALVGKPSGDNKPGDTTTETDVNGDIIENTPITLESVLMPIVVEDIPDDDLVDIYFASENGHSMFIETKEIEEKIVERNIDVAEKTPVYEVAQKVKEPVEIVIPDDNKSLVTTTEPVTKVVAVQGPPNDGVGDETTTEITTVPSTTAPTTTVPSTTVSTTTVPTTESTTVTTTEQTTEPTTEETTVHTHTEVTEEVKATCTENGIKTVKCSDCGEIISETVLTATGHTEKTTTEAATCTVNGKTTVTCSTCGETISETVLTATGHSEEKTTIEPTCTETGKETVTCTVCDELISETILDATGHREIFSGAKDAHTECSVCYEVLSTNHSYTTSTTNPSCTLDGGTTYVCECGYNYTDMIPATGHTEKTTTVDATCIEDGKTTVSCSVCTETLSETVIPATGHTEENGAGADIHTKCSVCGSTVKDGSYHDYTDEVTTQNTCTSEGVLTHTCTCGWSYTEAIPASHKKSDDGLTCVNGCGGVWVDLNSTNFPDSMFLSYISTTYDADGNNALIGNEVTGVVTINVAGDSTADGGYTDLTGIDKFTNLTTLNCAYNSGITSLDLSGLTKLESLDVTGLTGLETLNISGCTNLTDEKITGLDTCTELTTLDVSGCVNLAELNLNSNTKVETVNLSNCSALTSFVMGDDTVGNYLLNSIDLTGCNNLETLEINSAMYLTSFDFSDKTKIKSVDLGGCQGITSVTGLSGKTTLKALSLGGLNKMTELDVSGCTSLSELSISACTELVTINLTNTAITKFNAVETTVMDLSSYTKLQKAYLNGLTTTTSFVLTGATALKEFYLTNNVNIQSLDFSANTALEKLTLSSTSALTSLDISECASLNTLNLLDTGLTSLTLTEDNASALTDVQITNNNSLADISISGASVLTSIKLSDGTENYRVKNLSITNSAIETLDVSFLKSLETLNVSGCASITSLGTIPTTVTTLNVTGTGITTLVASACTELTALYITDCTSLEALDVSNTKISGLTIDDTYTSLDSVVFNDVESTSGRFSINNNNVKTVTAQNIDVQSFGVTSTSVTSIDLTGSTIGDGGMMSFSISNCGSSLETLTVSNSNLTILPTETMSALKTLNAENCTGLTSIDMITMPNIENLDISGCRNITTIDLTDCTALTDLDVSDTGITELDVSSCTSLVNLNASDTAITGLEANYSLYMETVDVSNCTSLDGLVMNQESNNNLTSVNVSGCTNMIYLQIENSNSLQELDLSGLSSLSAAYLTDCTAITSIDISNTQMSDISSLNISALSNFKTLKASNADLSDSELASMLKTSLEVIDVSDNSAVTSIDLTGFVNLKTLNVSNTGITDLLTSECVSLETIDASNCTQLDCFVMSTGSGDEYSALTSINVNVCTSITLFQISDAPNLETLDLSMLESLEELYVQNCPAITSLDISSSENILMVNVVDSGLTSGSITLPDGVTPTITGP